MSPALLRKSACHPIYATEPRDSGDLRALPSLAAELDRAGVTSLPMPQIAVFVGSLKGTDVSLNIKDGPRIHTFWGTSLGGPLGTRDLISFVVPKMHEPAEGQN